MIFPLACVGLLVVLLVPLPPPVLDLLLVLNLTLSVIILVTTISIETPREFAVFPSLLLAITLFRLAARRYSYPHSLRIQSTGAVMASR